MERQMPMKSRTLLVAALLVPALHASSAQAQTARTWISGTGDDTAACSRTAPCKTFAGALGKTLAGGEISTLDAGGYGTLNITGSLSIVAIGVEAGVLAPNTTGITINAGANDVVHLEGLVLDGNGSGASGISIISGGTVVIRRCLIRNFRGSPGLGIEIMPTAKTKVFVSDCAISANSGGVWTIPNGGTADVFLDRVQIVGNARSGIVAQGAPAVVRLNGSVVTGNAAGLVPVNGGRILSFQNNAVAGNGTDGQPTGLLKRQ
jgi:hypothetical protein